MSARVRDVLMGRLGELRHEPIERRVRAELDGKTVIDSTRTVLVWEPRRVVPSYAVPKDDIRGELVPAPAAPAGPEPVGYEMPDLSSVPVLDPSIPFTAHTAEGEPLALGGVDAYRLADPDLAGYVVVDFDGIDAWYEEEEQVISHPRDPFHRIDVLPSSRHVRLELDGHVLAESYRPQLLFETLLPTRYYLHREDVQVELRPSPTRTWCAYKGEASYLSPVVAGQVVTDLVWTYPEPRHDATAVAGLLAFFDERVDVVLDGVRRERPRTPWSPR